MSLVFLPQNTYYSTMTISLYIRILGLVLIAADLISMPFRKKKVDRQAGECVLPLTRTKSTMFVAVLCMAPLMVVLQWLREFGLFIDVILTATAVLAVEVVIRERILTMKSGVYKNALIVDGRLILKSSLMAVPELDYDDEETEDDSDEEDSDEEVDVSEKARKQREQEEDLYRRSVKIVTREAGELYVGFASETEKKQALELVKDWF